MAESYSLQYDESGRPYYQFPGQSKRNYVSPVALGEKPPEDTTGIFRSRPQWNQAKGTWETPIDWGNIANLAVGTALTAGAGSAAFGAGGAAGGAGGAGGVLPSSAISGLHAAIPGAITSQGVSAGIGTGAGLSGALAGSQIPGWARAGMTGPAAIASQRASRSIPWGGAADAAEDYLGGRDRGRGVGRAIGDAAGTANKLSPLLQSAIAALSGLPALLANNGPSNEEKALLDQARQMQALQQRRIEHQNPLYEAVTQLAMSRLPAASQHVLKPL